MVIFNEEFSQSLKRLREQNYQSCAIHEEGAKLYGELWLEANNRAVAISQLMNIDYRDVKIQRIMVATIFVSLFSGRGVDANLQSVIRAVNR
jgi:hypothetical protein